MRMRLIVLFFVVAVADVKKNAMTRLKSKKIEIRRELKFSFSTTNHESILLGRVLVGG